MCRYCIEFGNGTKWYLNPNNFRKELYYQEGHSTGFLNLTGVSRNSYEFGFGDQMDDFISDMNDAPFLNSMMDMQIQHAGQVVPLEDALKIVDVAPGERFLLQHCGCRRYMGHEDFYGCLFFDIVCDRTPAEKPWETDSKIITREEARKVIKDRHKQGLVISIFDAGTSAGGKAPLNFCFCSEADCGAHRSRVYLGATASFKKSEYIAQINKQKCKDGCKNNPVCLKRCQFGALKFNPMSNTVGVSHVQCFGCGLCRSSCPTQAIKLVDRTTYPTLVDNW